MIDNKGVIAFSIGKERKLAGRGWLFWPAWKIRVWRIVDGNSKRKVTFSLGKDSRIGTCSTWEAKAIQHRGTENLESSEDERWWSARLRMGYESHPFQR